METQPILQRQANTIELCTYAFVGRHRPQKVCFAEHQLDFNGVGPCEQFVYGMYGLDRLNAGLFHASAHSETLGEETLVLKMFFQLRKFEQGTSITREVAERTGFVHLGRLRKIFRDELHEELLEYLAIRVAGPRFEAIRRKRFIDLVAAYPDCARYVLSVYDSIDLVVHPVLLVDAEAGSRPMYLATVRSSQASKMKAQVRLFEDQIEAISVRRRGHRLHEAN